MKKNMLVACAVLATAWTMTTVAANIEVWGTFTISPSTPQYSNAMQNVMAFLTGSQHPSNQERIDPWVANIRPYYVENGIWSTFFRPGDAVSSTSSAFPIWDGTNTPSGVFTNQLGSRVLFPMHIWNAGAFVPNQVSFQMWSTEFYNSFNYIGNFATNTVSGQLQNWSETLVGLCYGPDGIKGTADDVMHKSGGPAIDQVNEVWYVGIRNGFTCSDTNSLEFALNYFRGQYPFDVLATYTLQNGEEGTSSGTARLSMRPLLVQRQADLTLYGQYDHSYMIYATTNVTSATNWVQYASGVTDHWVSSANITKPAEFFQAQDMGVINPPTEMMGSAKGPMTSPPTMPEN